MERVIRVRVARPITGAIARSITGAITRSIARSVPRLARTTTALAGALMIATAAHSASAAQRPTESVERPARRASWSWTAAVDDGTVLDIDAPRGSIHLRSVPGRTIRVHAERRGTRTDPATVQLVAEERAGHVVVYARHPGVEAPRSGSAGDLRIERGEYEGSDVEIDFTVEVPRGVTMRAALMRGDIRADHLASSAELRTSSGSIDLDQPTAHVYASAAFGDVTLVPASGAPAVSHTLRTNTGSIRVEAPATTRSLIRDLESGATTTAPLSVSSTSALPARASFVLEPLGCRVDADVTRGRLVVSWVRPDVDL